MLSAAMKKMAGVVMLNVAFGVVTTGAALAQATTAPSADASAPHNWTNEQILTCTVSQCWELAGKSEATFFDIVQQLAAISARNRGVTLPDDAAAGKRAGEYIKTKAKADHDALLFSIVDGSVRWTASHATASAAAK